MPNVFAISDIVKLLIKRIKSIMILTILISIISLAVYLCLKSDEPKVIYEEKIYGLINFSDQNTEENISLTINTIHDIYKSDSMKSSLLNLNYDEISDSFFIQNNLDKTDKEIVSNFIYDNFIAEFNELSKIFMISFQGSNENTVKYINEYIYNEGVKLTQTSLNQNITMFSKQINVSDNHNEIYSRSNIIKKFILFLATAFITVCLLQFFIIVLTDKIVGINQLRYKYNIDIFAIMHKKKYNYNKIKSILSYKLNKKNIKSVVFLSSNKKNYLHYLIHLKNLFEKEDIRTAIIVASELENEKIEIKDVYYTNYFYENEFWHSLENSYQFIFILSEPILDSFLTQEYIDRYKEIILFEQFGVSKDEQIERTIEKIRIYDGNILGFIIFE
jgi:hypothetical protein